MFPSEFKTRGYRGFTDLSGMAAVHNSRAQAEGRDEFTSVEELTTSYEHLQRCDPETDIVIVEDAAREIVGYGRTTWDDVSEGYRAYYAVVEAGPGPSELETAIFDWVEDRIENLAVEHDVPERRVEAWTDEASPRVAVLTARGFHVFRYGATLVRPTLDSIEDCTLPDGVEIRVVEDSHLPSGRPTLRRSGITGICRANRGRLESLARTAQLGSHPMANCLAGRSGRGSGAQLHRPRGKRETRSAAGVDRRHKYPA